MRFQLKHVVLWPRHGAHPPRTLDFKTGSLNVITGASKTGKSAVIPIIDYCLGSERCAVPTQTIRVACSWFGLVVQTSEGEKLLARREPGDQQSTGDMFLLEAESIQVPHSIEAKNTNVDAVKRILDRLAGLSNLGFDPSALHSGFQGRPSFRDMLAFNLQPQNIVANPDVLFFKADTLEHKEKLRTIFPYVLGAVTSEILAKRWEADQILRELKRKERDLAMARQTTEQSRAQLRAWVDEARDLGLIQPEKAADARSEREFIGLLDAALANPAPAADVTGASIDAAAKEMAEIEGEEGRVTLDLSEMKSRQEHMVRLRSAVDDYTGALKKQRDRLQLSRWLRELSDKSSRCAVCGGGFDEAHRELDALCDALASIEASAAHLNPVPTVLDRELVQVRTEVRKLSDRFQAVRIRRRAVEERSERIKQTRWQAASVDRFLGRTEQALKALRSTGPEAALMEEVGRLKDELEALRTAISEAAIKTRQSAALRRVSASMSRVLPRLDAERPNDPAELDIDDLTIRVIGASRTDHLWEIGSGANWLSYHIAAMLALHEFFIAQPASPVPSFLVLDQPSQVYFPRRLAREPVAGEDPHLADEDIAAVRKVFDVLAGVAAASRNELQVLVLDHAGSEVWGKAADVHMVDEWRDGKALVPTSWLPKSK